jgi:predicted nucleotidyltransferase
MYTYERNILSKIIGNLRERFAERIVAVYAFGSKVRGDNGEWSDFDVLIVVSNRDPLIEDEIMNTFVEEELKSGLMFTPLIKDQRAFDSEKNLKTPFYENIIHEGLGL